jgi:hypothetical protein
MTSAIVQLTENPILGGIISSVCFAAVSSGYLICVRRMRNISLKSLIPGSGSNVAVVCPGGIRADNQGGEAFMTSEEAMALAEVLQCIGTLNKEPIVYSCAETLRQSGIISIGGLEKNASTKTLLSQFCPGLKIGVAGPHSGETSISYGATTITPTYDKSIAFIIYLSSSITGCETAALLIFGQYGIDTVAAARYVRTQAKRLHRDFRGRSFAAQVVTYPTLGYQGFPKHHEDITQEVLPGHPAVTPRPRLMSRWHDAIQRHALLRFDVRRDKPARGRRWKSSAPKGW